MRFRNSTSAELHTYKFLPLIGTSTEDCDLKKMDMSVEALFDVVNKGMKSKRKRDLTRRHDRENKTPAKHRDIFRPFCFHQLSHCYFGRGIRSKVQ